MLTDPMLAHLNYVAFAEPEPVLMSLYYVGCWGWL